jgi:predicted nucleotidyltransferase
MEKSEVLKKLESHMAELRRQGVRSLAVFGSAVRDESRAGSDVDLLVEFDRPVGLFQFFALQHRLEEILGVVRVDLVERGAVHPALREHIYGEAIDVS